MDNPSTIIVLIIVIAGFIYIGAEEILRKKKCLAFINGTIEISPADFLKLQRKSVLYSNRKDHIAANDAPGVYVIYNATKDIHYVGKSEKVCGYLRNLFTGFVESDVLTDFTNNDDLKIRIYMLKSSDCRAIEELEDKILKKVKK